MSPRLLLGGRPAVCQNVTRITSLPLYSSSATKVKYFRVSAPLAFGESVDVAKGLDGTPSPRFLSLEPHSKSFHCSPLHPSFLSRRWFLHGRVGAQVFEKSPARCLNRCGIASLSCFGIEIGKRRTGSRSKISCAGRAKNLEDRLVLRNGQETDKLSNCMDRLDV